MNPMAAKPLIYAALLAFVCWIAYDYGATSVREDWNAERAEINKVTADALIKMNEQRKSTETELQKSESAAWEKYQNAQNESDRLSTELANRPWRVRIERAACDNLPGNTRAASVGDDKAEQYAELPVSTTRSVIEIGRDADQCEAKLKALQDYINLITK